MRPKLFVHHQKGANRYSPFEVSLAVAHWGPATLEQNGGWKCWPLINLRFREKLPDTGSEVFS